MGNQRRHLGRVVVATAAVLLCAAVCPAVPGNASGDSVAASAPADTGADPFVATAALAYVAVPEPTTVGLLVGGGILILARNRRRKP